jgi:hypothetical protein
MSQGNSVSRHSVAWRLLRLKAPFFIGTIKPWFTNEANARDAVVVLIFNSLAASRTE